jgi:hypothetical protein
VCACGCGKKTAFNPVTCNFFNWVVGHNPKTKPTGAPPCSTP